jgi:ParB/RepB/Spo0J family partition protein
MPTAPTVTPDIRTIPLGELHESPMNTRRHFDEHKLADLTASMRTTGQLTPILARPSTLPKKAGYEIAAGHRRRRAAELAGLDSLMVIVRDLDDRTFLEILTIENLQREDVHPLEEAQGYRNLLTIDGYDPKQIAERVGKSESYVYDRLKLLQLIPAAQDLFFANRFTLGHAIILARVGAENQTRILEPHQNRYGEGAGGGALWRIDHGHATLGLLAPNEEEGDYAGLVPVSVRQLQEWIDNHVRFDVAAESVAQLFPETAATLAQAEEKQEKIVAVTYDHQLHPDAKDEGARTYGPTSWKRADGQPGSPAYGEREKPSKECEYSVVGLVAAGEHRGESFRVCIDKKRCMMHWGDEIKARNARERAKEREASSPSKGSSASKPQEQSWEREQRLGAERTKRAKARWDKGGDAVLRAIAPHVRKLNVVGTSAAVEYFLTLIEDGLRGIRDMGKVAAKLGVARGSTPSDLMRHLIMVALLDRAVPNEYNATNEEDLQADLGALKIKLDVVKLLDAANPEPKVEPTVERKKAETKKPPAKTAPAKATKKPKRNRGAVTAQ